MFKQSHDTSADNTLQYMTTEYSSCHRLLIVNDVAFNCQQR